MTLMLNKKFILFFLITIILLGIIIIFLLKIFVFRNNFREMAELLYPDVLNYGKNLRFKAVPQKLLEFNNTHPRLFLTEEKIKEIHRLIETSDEYRNIWLKEKSLVDQWVGEKPPVVSPFTPLAGKRNEWQRQVGIRIPHYAICYLITHDEKYLRAAKDWILTAVDYPLWGEHDLSKSRLLHGVSIGYDWLYHNFTSDERERIRERLTLEARYWFLASLGLGEKYGLEYVWWYRSYLQNHLWIAACSLGVAGFALYGEVPDAEIWINQANNIFKKILASLDEDGAYHEGIHYWSYGLECLLQYLDLAKQLLGENLFDNAWLRNTAYYRLYNMLPRDMWGDTPRLQNCLDFADCNRRDSKGSEHILRKLAKEYNNSYAQWLANEIDVSNTGIPDSYWLNLLWYDPSVPATPPNDLPTFKHFENLGQVIIRSWESDGVLFSIKCGPPPGHKGLMMFDYDPGLSHVHPDVNHFVLAAYGEWLIMDDGYVDKKLTSNHNTILINGHGQLGEGDQWFKKEDRELVMSKKKTAAIIRCESNKIFDYIIGDAYTMYARECGLKKFLRHVIYLKSITMFIIIDEVETKKPSKIQWLLHLEGSLEKIDGNAFLLRNNKANLLIRVILPQNFNFKIYDTELNFENERGKKTTTIKKETVPTLELLPGQETNKTVFMVLLYPFREGEKMPTITEEIENNGKMSLLIQKNGQETRINFNLTREKRNDRIFQIPIGKEIKNTYTFTRDLPPPTEDP